MKYLIILSLFAFTACANQSVEGFAERALVAWRENDVAWMKSHAHSELIERMRHSRLINHHIEYHEKHDWDMDSAQRAIVIDRFFEAKRTVLPKDDRFTYFQEFETTEKIDDLMVVRFLHGYRATKNPDIKSGSPDQVVLRIEDGTWKFLWCQSARIHIDLGWNPIDD